jgi:hypothetical protein
MSKKIFLVFTVILMMFAFVGSEVVAGNVTTVYLELTKQTTSPYDPNPIRGRVTFLDATGNLADKFNDQPITDASLVISSLYFGDDVVVSSEPLTTPVNDLHFASAPLTIDLDSAWHEFVLSYDNIPEIGDDIIRAALKLGNKTFSAFMPVVVTGPLANCYVVRSGGIAALSMPEVLEPIPYPLADKGRFRRAGDSALIDVFAAYGVDTDSDGDVDEFIFTDNVPAGAENVSISGGPGASVVLVDGHVATTIQVTSLGLAGTLAAQTTAAGQLVAMQNAFSNGKTLTWSASSRIIPEIGTKCGDVNIDDQLDLCGKNTFGNIANLTLDASIPATFSRDTSLFFPDVIYRVNLVGLPVTSVLNTGATEGFLAGGEVSPLDAIYYLADWTTKNSTFKVNGDGSSDVVYGALVGFDAYKNPAPFVEGTTATFTMLTTAGAPAITAIAPWANGSGSTLTAAANSFFLPFQATVNVGGLFVASAPVAPSVISTINSAAKGVTYAIAQNVLAMPTSPPFPVVNTKAGGHGVTIGVTGTSVENSFSLRVVKQSGSLVKVNREGSTVPADTVSIPLKKAADNTAEQRVSSFTTVADVNLHYIFTGDSKKTIFSFKDPVVARVEPASSVNFPPATVSSSTTKAGAIIDTYHDVISACSFGVSDAFGNSYKFSVGGLTVSTIEDSYPTVSVFKANGTTPFPGASTSVDYNNIIVQFQCNEVPAGEGTAIVKLTAGSSSAQMELDVRALQKTILAAQFVPINGITDTPVMLSFGDQNGAMVSPVILKTCAVGSFGVGIEAVDGSLIGIGEIKDLTTDDPFAIFTAEPDAGKTSMTIIADGTRAYATSSTLTLDFLADSEAPACEGVDPAFGILGEAKNVTITGISTNFSNGISVASFSGAGITVSSTVVLSPNLVIATITINPGAALGARDVTVTTGTEKITCSAAFTVSAAPVTTTTTTITIDSDSDGVIDTEDNCPNKPNGPNIGTCSATSDKPGIICTSDADCANGCSSNALCIKDQRDADNDGRGDVCDNCPTVCNSQQLDANGNGIGDVCDTDPGCGGCSGTACEQLCS